MNSYFYKIKMISRHITLFCSLYFPAGAVILVNAYYSIMWKHHDLLNYCYYRVFIWPIISPPGLFSFVLSFLVCLLLHELNSVWINLEDKCSFSPLILKHTFFILYTYFFILKRQLYAPTSMWIRKSMFYSLPPTSLKARHFRTSCFPLSLES